MTTKEELREKLQKDLENNGNLEEINRYLEEMRKRRAKARAKAASERPQLSAMPPKRHFASPHGIVPTLNHALST